MFAHCLNVKQFYFIHKYDCQMVLLRDRVDLGAMAIKRYSKLPKVYNQM